MSKITLSVKERLLLSPCLPVHGGRIEMIIVGNLGRIIEFTPEEVQEFELVDAPNGAVRGNPAKFRDKTIELSGDQVKVLKSIPGKLDDNKQVTLDLLPLLDKIDALTCG